MDSLLDHDKTSNLNNNNSMNESIDSNANIKDKKALSTSIHDASPASVSPTISETIYEFGSHFETPSHVVSERVSFVFVSLISLLFILSFFKGSKSGISNL